MGNLKQVPVCGEICQQFSSLHNFKTKPNNGYIDNLCLMKGLGACFTIDSDTGWLLGFETFFSFNQSLSDHRNCARYLRKIVN